MKLSSSLETGWGNFTGILVRKPPATPKGVPAEYVMQPFEVKLAYNGKSWLTVPLEIGFDEIGDADQPEYFAPEYLAEIFEELGLPAPAPIPLMPLHHQIAQKLHGLTESGSMRVHDLIDLQVIAREGEVDLARTKATCNRLFTYRKKQVWPPDIRNIEAWRAPYEEQSDGLDVLPDIDSAAQGANEFVAMIESTE